MSVKGGFKGVAVALTVQAGLTGLALFGMFLRHITGDWLIVTAIMLIVLLSAYYGGSFWEEEKKHESALSELRDLRKATPPAQST
jgi:hypothetical protein